MRSAHLSRAALCALAAAALAGCGSAPRAVLRPADESRLMRHVSDARRAATSSNPQAAQTALGALAADVRVLRGAGRLDDAQARRLQTEIGQARARVLREVRAPRPAPKPIPAPVVTPPPAAPPTASPVQKAKDLIKHTRDALGKFLQKVRGDKQGGGGGGQGGGGD